MLIKNSPAVEEFLLWLPGELRYSAAKAPYPNKIERAHLSPADPQSIYGFLGNEWHQHQLLREQGNQHADAHQKTAQLQLAKFAAGLFDKAALGYSFLPAAPADCEPGVIDGAEYVTKRVEGDVNAGRLDYWLRAPFESADTELQKPFDEIGFARGVRGIMTQIVNLAESMPAPDTCEQATSLINNAVALGETALVCYNAYAMSDLAPDEYFLAPSELAA